MGTSVLSGRKAARVKVKLVCGHSFRREEV